MTLPNAGAGRPELPPHPSAALRGLRPNATEPPYDDELRAAAGLDGTRRTGADADAARAASGDQVRPTGDDEAPRPHVGRRTIQSGSRRGPGTAGSSHGRGARRAAGGHRGPGEVRPSPSAPSPTGAASRAQPRATDDIALLTAAGRANLAAHPAARRAPLRVPSQARDSRLRENPGPAATIVVRAIVEVLAGVRPGSHLAGWATPRLQAALERFGGQYPGRGSVRSIRIGEPRPGVAEVAAVVNRGDRVAALALRMELTGGRWQVTNLQIG